MSLNLDCTVLLNLALLNWFFQQKIKDSQIAVRWPLECTADFTFRCLVSSFVIFSPRKSECCYKLCMYYLSGNGFKSSLNGKIHVHVKQLSVDSKKYSLQFPLNRFRVDEKLSIDWTARNFVIFSTWYILWVM